MHPLAEPNRGAGASAAAVGLLFPGQGSQYAGMADPWLADPRSAAILEHASDVLRWDVAAGARDSDALRRTDVVQPAVLACDLAAFEILRAEGVQPACAAGHSLGEYAALVASGAVDFDAAFRTVDVRAKAMQRAVDLRAGGMTTLVGLSPEEVREVCEVAGRGDVLRVANENGPREMVVSGSVAALERAEALARNRGSKAVRLNVAGAFHSPLMDPAVQSVREAIARTAFREPAFPVVPNVSGRPTRQPLALRDLLNRHIASPVRWEASVRAMAELEIGIFVEAGPGNVLADLTRRAAPGVTVRTAGTPEQARDIAASLRAAENEPRSRDAL